jgi:DNA replication initiation complex subunit (GINS family)
MEEQFREKCKEVKAIRQSFVDDLANTRKELSETRGRLDEARIRENDVLRQMLNSKS